mmetsp:Transcript_27924/g.32286  ORF Transcript_27924/g.32286 Transcript_27924/m.32286 type:complete len:691 (+) Transcript_27924:71-2143(+)|eukprot:CAMPEP_0176428292 /NCGR_PEP_ID=MMETSP0127-20121128/13066_1 /TAXON_ID=938130 /ORGANISM="Platyophrya macrostoma, Strain WH" /LENGTH=690 /DNA_ID=CAMNT_0017809953 /DNA_START=58 /DNA_END=2130 /DNA_ORIENTATION=-
MDDFEKYKESLKTPGALKFENQRPKPYDRAETDYLAFRYLRDHYYSYDKRESEMFGGSNEWERKEIHNREDALGALNEIVQIWIQRVASRKGMNAQQGTARILTFGSHRLGVNTRGGDLDTVLLVPNYVDRDEDFFDDLGEILRTDPDVKGLVKVNDKNVAAPIIKMEFRDIAVDMGFARLDAARVDDKIDVLDNRTLTNMDDQMINSFNGSRNVELIVKSVSQNIEDDSVRNFRTTLKFIKLWAKNKGVYSNAIGYLGGISWAIMTAKICQMFPRLLPNRLLRKFFKVYSQWKWNDIPVIIHPVTEDKNLESQSKRQWVDPEKMDPNSYNYASMAKGPPQMSVITPAFPCMNSTSKVRSTNLKVIDFHLKEGWELMKKKPINWDKLFEEFNFFKKFKYFIRVDVLGDREEEFDKWSGWVESQLIFFTNEIENMNLNMGEVMDVYPYPESYSCQDEKYNFSKVYFYGIQARELENQWYHAQLDLRPAAVSFIEKIRRRREQGSNIKIQKVSRYELPDFVFPKGRPKWAIGKNVQPQPSIPIQPKESMTAQVVRSTVVEAEETKVEEPRVEEIKGQEAIKKVKKSDANYPSMDAGRDFGEPMITRLETNGLGYVIPSSNGHKEHEGNGNGVSHQSLMEFQAQQAQEKWKTDKFNPYDQPENTAPGQLIIPQTNVQMEAVAIVEEDLDELLN